MQLSTFAFVSGRVRAVFLTALLAAASLSAQDVFEITPLEDEEAAPVETAAAAEDAAETAAQAAPEGYGIIEGTVFDNDTGVTVSGVTILVDENAELIGITDDSGTYRILNVPAGLHELSFSKSGYRNAIMRDLNVPVDGVAKGDFPLPPAPVETSMDTFEFEVFEISANDVGAMMANLELRLESDQILDMFSSEDFSKFAAGSVAEAIKRIPGVSVQDGQFAVIRGLDERYSSTLFNGAPVPSPDPDRQSVPLDLFPSDVVSNLEVSKTFSPFLPGNSAGGSLNIISSSFPDEISYTIKLGTSFNDNAVDSYVTTGGRRGFNVDLTRAGLGNNAGAVLANTFGYRMTPDYEDAPIESDFSFQVGGTTEFFDREVRYRISFAHERDFSSDHGFENNRAASPGQGSTAFVQGSPFPGFVINQGDLAAGQLSYTYGNYDYIRSQAERTATLLTSLEFDLDEDGNQSVGFNFFKTDFDQERATLKTSGDISDMTDFQIANDYNAINGLIAQRIGGPGAVNDLFRQAEFFETNTVEETRALEIKQLYGKHTFGEESHGLDFEWLLSQANTSQEESDSITTMGIELPNGTYVSGQTTGFSDFNPTRSWRRTAETQDFLSTQATHHLDLNEHLRLESSAGASYEKTQRTVGQEYFTYAVAADLDPTIAQAAAPGNTIEEAIQNILNNRFNNNPPSSSFAQGSREIRAFNFGSKLTVNEKLDFIAGMRIEDVFMSTTTSTGADFFNYELLRNTATPGAAVPTQAVVNTQLLGIGGPLPANFVGEIDETLFLPSLGLVYRPIEDMRMSFVYSRTNARPSFREFTYITTQDPVTGDYISGNPTLTTSDVENFDARVEYLFGERGDLIALSVFYKTIKDPIEKTTINGAVQTDIFFNNPNDAELYGFEVEARKYLDFTEMEWLDDFSLGGNFSLIKATVEVPQNFQDLLSGGFNYTRANGAPAVLGGTFYANPDPAGNPFNPSFAAPGTSRALFNQPEWIVNGDISYDNQDWGTRATLSVYAQSRVLDAAAGYIPGNLAVPDRYLDSYYQLDFTLSQRITDYLSVSFSAKNITDTPRSIIYDDDVVTNGANTQREVRAGRDFSISLTASF